MEPGTQLTSLAPGTRAPPLLRGRKLPGSGPPRVRAGPSPGQWGGVRRATHPPPRPGNHRLWGGHRAEGGGQTGSKSQSRTGEHGPPRGAHSQSEAGSRATRRHSNQFNLLPPPCPSAKEKREGRGNTGRCHSRRKARPHPALQPMAQERLIRTFQGDATANQKNVEAGRSQYANEPPINVAAKASFW